MNSLTFRQLREANCKRLPQFKNSRGEPQLDFREIAPFYVHHNGSASFVKEGNFFREQGGLTEAWGSAWIPVAAESIEHARKICEELHRFGPSVKL